MKRCINIIEHCKDILKYRFEQLRTTGYNSLICKYLQSYLKIKII